MKVYIDMCWSVSKLSTSKCKLLVIVKLRYIIMRYFYQIRHILIVSLSMLLYSKLKRESLPATWVGIGRVLQLSNIWSGRKFYTTKCQLVVIVNVHYYIMRYSYQIWHFFNCRDNFSNSYFNDELLFMNGGVLQDPTEALLSTLHVPLFL